MAFCPRCGEALRAQQFGAVAVDGCDSCGGLWFDANELAQLAKGGAMNEAETAFAPPVGESPDSLGDMRCPRCNVALYEFEFPHTPGVKLNACSACKGVFVDDRELAGIAQRTGRPKPESTVRTTTRVRARVAVTFIQQRACPRCGEQNPVSALVCWACSAELQSRQTMVLCPRCDSHLEHRVGDTSWLEMEGDPEVDHCVGCGGIWIEAGGLSLLMMVPADWLDRWSAQLAELSRSEGPARQQDIVCPACQVRMEERAYGSGGDIHVDRCGACEGMWLDSGELILVRRISVQEDVWQNRE